MRAIDEIAHQDEENDQINAEVNRLLRLHMETVEADAGSASEEDIRLEEAETRTRILSQLNDIKIQLDSGELQLGPQWEKASQLLHINIEETPEMRTLKESLEQKQEEVGEKERRIVQLETSCEDLRTTSSDISKKYDALQKRHESLSINHSQINRKHGTLTTEIAAITEDLRKYRSQAKELDKKVESLEQEKLALEKTANALRRRMRLSDESNLAVGKQLTSVQEPCEMEVERQKDLAGAEKRNAEEWRKKYQKSQLEVRKHEGEAFKAKDNLGTAEDRCKHLEFKLQCAENEPTEASSRADQYAAEIKALEQCADATQTKHEIALPSVEQRMKDSEKELTSCKQTLQAKTQEASRLHKSLELLREELQAKTKVKDQKILGLEQKVRRLEKTLKESRDERDSSVRTLQIEKAELQDLLSTAESDREELIGLHDESQQRNAQLRWEHSKTEFQLNQTKAELERYVDIVDTKHGNFEEMKGTYDVEIRDLKQRLENALLEGNLLREERDVALGMEENLTRQIEAASSHADLLDKELDHLHGLPGVKIEELLDPLYNIRYAEVDLPGPVPVAPVDFHRLDIDGLVARCELPTTIVRKLLALRRRLLRLELYDQESMQILLDVWRTLAEPTKLRQEDRQRLYLTVHDLAAMLFDQTENLAEESGPLIAWLLAEVLCLLGSWRSPSGKWEQVLDSAGRLLDFDIPPYTRSALIHLQSLVTSLLGKTLQAPLTYMEAFRLTEPHDDGVRSMICHNQQDEEVQVGLACLADGQFVLLEQEHRPLTLKLCAGQAFKFRRIGFIYHLIVRIHGETHFWPLHEERQHRAWIKRHGLNSG